jgi:integrase
MATVSKRAWTTKDGERHTAWRLSYVDANGERHQLQFTKKAEADAERIRVEGQLAAGVHVPDKASITVLDAGKAFLADFEKLVDQGKREKSTLRGYQQHVNLHLAPYALAKIKLSRLGSPDCKTYAEALEESLSDAMAPRVMSTIRTILNFAQTKGWIASNPALAVKIRTAGDRGEDAEEVNIPPKAQIKALFEAAKMFDDTGFAEAMVAVLAFGGLRASEMRGLRRRDLRLNEGKIDVRQRADRWNVIGPCKTKNSRRTVPIPPVAVAAIKRWLKNTPPSQEGLVFPNGIGNVESYANIYNRVWVPLMEAAELVDVAVEGKGQDAVRKISPWFALHTLRHVACSLWIEQGAPAKKIQTWAGHASIQFTQDRYGHLWADEISDQAITRAIEKSLLG